MSTRTPSTPKPPPGDVADAPSTMWSDRLVTIRRNDTPFVDRLLRRGLVTRSEHARLTALVRESRLTVRMSVPFELDHAPVADERVRRSHRRAHRRERGHRRDARD